MKSALIVDGEPPIGEILEEVLKSEGTKAVTMALGSEAADYALAHRSADEAVFGNLWQFEYYCREIGDHCVRNDGPKHR